MKIHFVLCLVIGVFVAADLQAMDATPADLEWHEVEVKLIERTNAARIRNGLPALQMSAALMKSARAHTAWMCNSNTLVHTTQPVAENIAMGQHSVDQAIADWLNSPGHRANLLSANYSKIGVAAYRSKYGTIYWCQQFIW